MVSLCTDSPLPTFNSLYDSFAANLTFPPTGFSFPVMPTLPSPMFPSMSIPNLEAVKVIAELQGAQLMSTIMGMIMPMVSFLGFSLESILPKIPGLDLSLIDLLSVNPQAIYDAVKQVILDGVEDLATLWPFIPLPLYSALNIPDLEITQIVSNLVRQYSGMLVDFVTGLVEKVTGKLEIQGMPAIPTLPTFNDIKALILAKVPGVDSLYEVFLSGISISDMFDITIPGFPPMPTLPSPLVPSVSIPEFDLTEGIGILMNHLNTFCFSMVMDFIDGTLGSFIPFSFPTICITL